MKLSTKVTYALEKAEIASESPAFRSNLYVIFSISDNKFLAQKWLRNKEITVLRK